MTLSKRHFYFPVFILIPILTGWLSALMCVQSMQVWYAESQRPYLSPPAWLFGPVWTILYTLMGYSSYRIFFSQASVSRSRALWLYCFQLALNFLWSPLFFRWNLSGWALADIVTMIVLVILMILEMYKTDRTAAYLQMAYPCWLFFATYLNAWYFFH